MRRGPCGLEKLGSAVGGGAKRASPRPVWLIR